MPCKACHKPKPKPEIRVKLAQGRRYIWLDNDNSDDYILAQVDYQKFTLISLTNGNRWTEPRSLEDLQDYVNKRHCFKAAN